MFGGLPEPPPPKPSELRGKLVKSKEKFTYFRCSLSPVVFARL
jgi:hypothetical protein